MTNRRVRYSTWIHWAMRWFTAQEKQCGPPSQNIVKFKSRSLFTSGFLYWGYVWHELKPQKVKSGMKSVCCRSKLAVIFGLQHSRIWPTVGVSCNFIVFPYTWTQPEQRCLHLVLDSKPDFLCANLAVLIALHYVCEYFQLLASLFDECVITDQGGM